LVTGESAPPVEDLTEGMDDISVPARAKGANLDDDLIAELIRNHPNNLNRK
jgi:hypothetical protein